MDRIKFLDGGRVLRVIVDDEFAYYGLTTPYDVSTATYLYSSEID